MELELRGQQVSQLQTIRDEIDDYYTLIRSFADQEPDEILVQLSAISARMSEIRTQLMRNEARWATALRTKEVDPLLEAIELQFKLWSRIITVKNMDWEISRGQT